MNKKRILIFGVVFVLLCLLIWLQVRTWKNFDWATFRTQNKQLNWSYVLAGVGFTYLAYVLRAVRWRIFLKPVRQTTTMRLLAPQFVGFACLAMLGRAGEMIRPYIIAKKERLTFTSQIAVWGVERIFDMGAFAVMLAVSLLSPHLKHYGFYAGKWEQVHWRWVRFVPFYHGWIFRPGLREFSVFLIVFILVLIATVLVLRRSGDRVGQFFYDRFQGLAPRLAHHLRDKILSFSHGLETIQDLASALQLVCVSFVMWVLIAFAYYAVTHAYPGELQSLKLADEIVLMGSSMVGSLLQLPAVGGGSQLATISMLNGGFNIKPELAVSCGMLLWATTFMSVIPMGLLLARREHVSIRAISEAEEKALVQQS